MSKESSNVERKTEIQVQKPGCSVTLNGCVFFLAGVFLVGILANEYKRSKVRLEMDNIKLEQMKKDTVTSHVTEKTMILAPDTLRIGNYQRTYVPLLRHFQNQKGN